MDTIRARVLRRNMTSAEVVLWRVIRNRQLRGCKFRREQPVGRFIVDFICFEKKLIIELDGSHHADQQEKDLRRTRWLEEEGYKVMRFWNNEIFEKLDGVKEVIWEALE